MDQFADTHRRAYAQRYLDRSWKLVKLHHRGKQAVEKGCGIHAGGSDMSIDEMTKWFAEASALSKFGASAMAHSFYRRLKAQGRIFGEWPEGTGEARPQDARPQDAAPLNPEWHRG